MNVDRAREIIQSRDKIEVEYQGKAVWLDGVDENSQMVRVHVEERPEESMTVAVNQLVER